MSSSDSRPQTSDPVRDERYADYSVRRLCEGMRDKVDTAGTFSSTQPKYSLVHEVQAYHGTP